MRNAFSKILKGYQSFREKYAHGDQSVMRYLSNYGQQPQIMVVACCDSRVDPALILQCDPGDLFVVRNVANIVPPYEKDDAHHGTSAALEFGVRVLKVKHLILLGHSQCGGILALLQNYNLTRASENSVTAVKDNDKSRASLMEDDFITSWVSLIKTQTLPHDSDDCAKLALHQSYHNCMTFPWIKDEVIQQKLQIHQWFFDIKLGQIFTYNDLNKNYEGLD